MCYFLLDNITNLCMLSLGTLVTQGPCGVFYTTRCITLMRSKTWHSFLLLTLIWYHTHTKQRHTTHTEANRLTHSDKCILAPLFYQPLIFMGKIWKFPFLGTFQNFDIVFCMHHKKSVNFSKNSKNSTKKCTIPIKKVKNFLKIIITIINLFHFLALKVQNTQTAQTDLVDR